MNMAIMIVLTVGTGLVLMLIEKMWPAGSLPRVRGWGARIVLVNVAQAGLVVLAGLTWDRFLQQASIFRLREHFGDVSSALIAYLVSCFVYYWWHRVRHESSLFWRLCHQLHHSPRRIEILTSFYKHPVEIALNSLLSSAIVYSLLGVSVKAAAIYTFITALSEFFYHWNVRTPRWLGYFIQRPESHRVHHQYQRHTQNYADLPIFDMLFGTFVNPRKRVQRCGFDSGREGRFGEMLLFRDVHNQPGKSPTCFGCRKRWICQATAEAS